MAKKSTIMICQIIRSLTILYWISFTLRSTITLFRSHHRQNQITKNHKKLQLGLPSDSLNRKRIICLSALYSRDPISSQVQCRHYVRISKIYQNTDPTKIRYTAQAMRIEKSLSAIFQVSLSIAPNAQRLLKKHLSVLAMIECKAFFN